MKTFLLISALLIQDSAYAQSLTLQKFLQEVQSSNMGVKGSTLSRDGATKATGEGELLTSTNLFINAAHSSDERLTAQPSFQGTRTQAKNYSLGLSKLTTFGLSGKLYFNINDIQIDNAPALPLPQYKTGAPTIELNQSLLRNGFGRETEATLDLVSAGTLANKFAEAYKVKAKLLEAELTYWRLSFARESVAIQKEILDRSKKVFDWTSKRFKMNLGDRSDMLQAQAALQGRTLELQMAQDEESAASRAFNISRQVDSETVNEKLEDLSSKELLSVQPIVRKTTREDVLAAEQAQKATEASAKISREKALPTLDIYGTYSYNSRESSYGDAVQKSLEGRYPASVIGVKFSTPLDFSTVSESREGRALEIEGAKLNYQRKIYEEDREWKDLNLKLSESQQRLKLATDLRALQKQKLEYERDRLMRGRTTTFQVLLFEQDYAQAQINQLKSQMDVMRTVAQLKLFGGPQ